MIEIPWWEMSERDIYNLWNQNQFCRRFRDFYSFSARTREREKNNLIGLSIELRRRKSFIGRMKKIDVREREKMIISFFLLLLRSSRALIDHSAKEKGSKSLAAQRKRKILFLLSKEIAIFLLIPIDENTSKVSIRIKPNWQIVNNR